MIGANVTFPAPSATSRFYIDIANYNPVGFTYTPIVKQCVSVPAGTGLISLHVSRSVKLDGVLYLLSDYVLRVAHDNPAALTFTQESDFWVSQVISAAS